MDELVSKICGHLPDGFELRLCMENGSVAVVLFDNRGINRPLPDQTGKSLKEQLNDALCAANGFV